MISEPEYLDMDNLDHAPDIANALGQMVVTWAKAETMLSWAFARVFGIHPNRAFFGFYRIPTFEARVKVLLTMAENWETTEYDKEGIKKLIEKLSEKSEYRNAWIHGVWCKNKHSNETVIFRFRKAEGKGRMKVIRHSDILAHLRSVREATAKLQELVRYQLA